MAIIIGLVVLSLFALFSLQNAAPVTIAFLFWKFEASLAIALFLSAIAGAVIASVIAYTLAFRRSLRRPK